MICQCQMKTSSSVMKTMEMEINLCGSTRLL